MIIYENSFRFKRSGPRRVFSGFPFMKKVWHITLPCGMTDWYQHQLHNRRCNIKSFWSTEVHSRINIMLLLVKAVTHRLPSAQAESKPIRTDHYTFFANSIMMIALRCRRVLYIKIISRLELHHEEIKQDAIYCRRHSGRPIESLNHLKQWNVICDMVCFKFVHVSTGWSTSRDSTLMYHSATRYNWNSWKPTDHDVYVSFTFVYCNMYQHIWNRVTGQHRRSVLLLNAFTMYKCIWNKKLK